jgi:hypothetical protein
MREMKLDHIIYIGMYALKDRPWLRCIWWETAAGWKDWIEVGTS